MGLPLLKQVREWIHVGRVRHWARRFRRRLAASSARQRALAWPPAPPVRVAHGGGLKDGVTVVGYLTAMTGVGEVARGSARALALAGVPVRLVSLMRPAAGETGPDGAAHVAYACNLLHVNSDGMPAAFAALGRSFFVDKRNIGFWFWEMTEWPDTWRDRFPLLDEIWVASAYTQRTLSAGSPLPVVKMPVVIEPEAGAPLTRDQLGLPSGRFVFLFAFDALSIVERKNPFAVVEAYRRAFGRTPADTALVIKMNNLDIASRIANSVGLVPGLAARLAEAVADVSGMLLNVRLDRTPVNALVGHCDCYVSLHRCEGFCLTIAEAMYFGKPCIATGWSGNLEYMTAQNSYLVNYRPVELDRDWGPYRAGWVWAEPDIDHAAQLMREVCTQPSEAQGRGALAAHAIRNRFSAAAVGRAMRAQLSATATQEVKGI